MSLKIRITLPAPIEIRDGVEVKHLTVNGFVLEEDGLLVNFDQGISKMIPKSQELKDALATLEALIPN